MHPMKRKTKRLLPMILVFTIIAAAYSCRMLALFDIGGACVRKQFLKVFSEEFTDKTLNRAIADKELIEYKGDVYVVCKKRKGDASYNGCVNCVRDEGNGKFTVVIAVTMPPSDNKLYVDLPTEKNVAGEFVFSDYPYWERSE